MKCQKAYAIMSVGKKDVSAHSEQQKTPELRPLGFFYSVSGGWLKPKADWVNREYRQLFTKNQFHEAMKHAKVNNLSTVTYEQVLSIFNSYLLFNGRK